MKQMMLLCCGLMMSQLYAQTYTMTTTGSMASTTCSGTFYDNGGAVSNYSNNCNATYTFTSGSVPNKYVRLDFTLIALDALKKDTLFIYDGPTTTSPIWAVITGTLSVLPSYTASLYNLTGQLTVKFKSNSSTTAAGWAATISCSSSFSTPPTNQDAQNKRPICTTASLSDNNNGVGYKTDLNSANQGCLTGGETNSSWYYFKIKTAGTFTFDISPNNTSSDFDFGVWGPNPTTPPNTSPIRCSGAYHASGGGTPQANTGLKIGSVDNTEGPSGDGYVAPLTVSVGQLYTLMVDNFTVNSGFVITFGGTASVDNSPCTAPLPIELLSLKAQKEGQGAVDIVWTTATEHISDQIWIERLCNTDFTPIGMVQAAGQSATTRHYSFLDKSPCSGTNYYRLKEVDLNGGIHFSAVVSIDIDKKNGLLEVKPNVLSSLKETSMTVSIQNSGIVGDATLLIVNTQGQQVYSQQVYINEQDTNQWNIEQMLHADLYMVVLATHQQVFQTKIMVE